LDIDVIHSSRNVGGFGRFYFARRLAHEYRQVVFVDDDQLPPADFVSTLAEEHRPETVLATRAFRFQGERYWDRVAARPGERAKYCGSGGMICDTRIFLERALFECPRRFWFVEDLWLSYFADRVLGWPLYKSRISLAMEVDEHDQFHYLRATKDRMFRYLVRKGWEPDLANRSS
jgi:hypothetical protein